MKEITKNQATAIWRIFFVLWLTVGSIVCFNIHCITSEPPIYAPMFAITPLYLIEFYFDHPDTVLSAFYGLFFTIGYFFTSNHYFLLLAFYIINLIIKIGLIFVTVKRD